MWLLRDHSSFSGVGPVRGWTSGGRWVRWEGEWDGGGLVGVEEERDGGRSDGRE